MNIYWINLVKKAILKSFRYIIFSKYQGEESSCWWHWPIHWHSRDATSQYILSSFPLLNSVWWLYIVVECQPISAQIMGCHVHSNLPMGLMKPNALRMSMQHIYSAVSLSFPRKNLSMRRKARKWERRWHYLQRILVETQQ